MSPRLSALRLSLAYLAIAIAWAFLSDHLLQGTSNNARFSVNPTAK
ncbi:hypothetical protein GRH76_33515 [Pseudomonas aeruginosa]|nr:hypothetical protein [Pseudomonas aeruginosa]MDK7793658.1 hypothetical protein [Pseudomonas aeruginosa]MWW02951.1 hypothetical protein [Pseudomonas aeruginosa]MWW42016.1 hypothetical protein [Pseudomonas aeruginosa]